MTEPQTETSPHLMLIVTDPFSAAKLIAGQIEFLKSNGLRVTVVSAPGPTLDFVGEKYDVRTIGVPMQREMSPFSDAKSLWKLWRVIRSERPDIINAGTPKAGLLGMLAARLSRTPHRVYTLRGLRLETVTGWRRKLFAFCERLASGSSQRVLCVSDSLREVYTDLKLCPPNKAEVLGRGASNGVDVSRFDLRANTDQVAEVRARWNVPSSAPVLGFVGRLVRDKGVLEVADVYRTVRESYPDLHLLLVGDFEEGDAVPESVREELRADNQVHITGFVDDPALAYSLMDVMLFPSKREGFPNVVIEAGASRTPVVAYDATGTRDALVDGTTGTLVPLGDVDALASAVRDYLDDPLRIRRHGEAAHAHVSEHFTHEVVWSNLLGFYQGLLRAA